MITKAFFKRKTKNNWHISAITYSNTQSMVNMAKWQTQPIHFKVIQVSLQCNTSVSPRNGMTELPRYNIPEIAVTTTFNHKYINHNTWPYVTHFSHMQTSWSWKADRKNSSSKHFMQLLSRQNTSNHHNGKYSNLDDNLKYHDSVLISYKPFTKHKTDYSSWS